MDHTRLGRLGPFVLVLALVCAVVPSACRGRGETASAAAAPPLATGPAYVAEVEAWRAKHEADYRRDYVTIAGLHPLEPGSQTAGSAPANDIVLAAGVPPAIGRFVVEGGRVQYEPAPGVAATQDGTPVGARALLRVPERPPEPAVQIGDVSLVVHMSGERPWLRVRDPNGAPARAFQGFRWFPIDPAFRVIGRFVRDAEPTSVPVPSTVGDLQTYRTEGVVEFTLQGRTLRLRPFTTRPKRFYFVFRDASAGQETYKTARFLYADLRDDGRVVLDFNQAYNPPCAFNPYTTCPIPLRENVLPVKMLAGERAYPVDVAAAPTP
jgi:uncharacterized protein (DUF1684 family)